jgi:GNAT superfamily N-acetyltransferase
MQIVIRVIGLEDVAAVRALIAASVRGLQVEYTEAQREAALKTVFTVDTRLVADGGYYGAFAGDRMVGCGGWSGRKTLYGGDAQVEAIEPERLDPEVDAAKVRAIFVDPEFARMGIGGRLLEAAEDGARAAGFRRFEMGSTLSGIGLYALRGYVEVERLEVPVGGGEKIGVVKMVKEI